jgi:hypothetical protein
MGLTIFYSWQSDISNKINRNFIEDALKRAIDKVKENFEVQEALREEDIKFDKDTQGVPGTPPITDVIFDKISKCSIFVPDLTFVGKTEKDRMLSNPNVLIEYGYALKSLSTTRIIPVMNTAFGDPIGNSLPFNMRHLRNPLTYNLTESASGEEKRNSKELLIRDLAKAIETIVKSGLLENPLNKPTSFEETLSKENPSTFLQAGEAFTIMAHAGSDKPLYIPNVARIFLRIIPTASIPAIKSSKAALDLIQSGRLAPMGYRGYGVILQQGRNKWGAFSCHQIVNDDKVSNLTQLFINNELWGIDATSIEKESHTEFAKVDFGYFPSLAFEKVFNETLANYLSFVSAILKLPPPLKFIAGATDVEGYRMAMPGSFPSYSGIVVNKDIVFEGMIDGYEKKPADILRPFFNHVWEECGLERPDIEILK